VSAETDLAFLQKLSSQKTKQWKI